MELSGATRSQLAKTFTHPGVADAYQHRPPYPAQVFDLLERLITDQPRTVLDLGAGEGAIARPLASRAEHVDAVDISAAMIAAGQRRPGGGGRTCAGSPAPPRPLRWADRTPWSPPGPACTGWPGRRRSPGCCPC